MKSFIYGTAAGAVGALAWAGIAYATDYEVGYVAIAVGALVGLAVAAGSRESRRSPTALGVMAVILAMLSIVAGKIAMVDLFIPDDDEIVAMYVESYQDEEFVMSFIADAVVEEYVDAGRQVDWPVGVDPSTASAATDYPSDVWAETVQRWSEMTEDEQEAFGEARLSEVRANLEASLPAIRASMGREGLFASFSAIDLIFFGLAMLYAWRFGSGTWGTANEGPRVDPSPDARS